MTKIWVNIFTVSIDSWTQLHGLLYTFASEIAESATSLIRWLNNHGKVCMIFDDAQAQSSLDCTGHSVVLAYLVANLTWWTTYCVTFIQLWVQSALKLEVMQHCVGLIKAQVGVATSAEKLCLTEDAEKHCNLIADPNFWHGLEHIVGDIEPICYWTIINQKDSTRTNQVLLTLVGTHLHLLITPFLRLWLAWWND